MARRGFTILETVLAASLASVIVLGCMTAFFAMERTDQALSARFQEANDLARIQRTMQRAFTSLQLSQISPDDEEPADDAAGENGGEQPLPIDGGAEGEGERAAEGEEAVVDPAAAQMPRILLEQDLDPTLTTMITRASRSGGRGAVASPQRLELVLSSVPIRPPSVQSTVWADALVGVDDLAAEAVAEAEGAEEYDGLRGAFVLRPDDPTGREARARAGREDDRVGWTLWWQPLDDRSEPARVASSLAACNFQMFHDRQMLSEHIAYAERELPTYIQLEVETLSGLYANYLFEVVWTVDTIDEEQAAATAAANGENGANGADGAQNGNGRPGDGAGGRGGRGRDGDSAARPKPLTPQGAGAGRRVPGRPGQSLRPGEGPGGGGSGGGDRGENSGGRRGGGP